MPLPPPLGEVAERKRSRRGCTSSAGTPSQSRRSLCQLSLDYNGKAAYYVVNNSVTADCTATLNFSEAASGYVHNYSGKTDITKKKSLEIALGAGKAALVVLD